MHVAARWDLGAGDGIKGSDGGENCADWNSPWLVCRRLPAEIFRQGGVTGQGWGNCRGGADVILDTINGGGHGWPGDVAAAQMNWSFFLIHPFADGKLPCTVRHRDGGGGKADHGRSAL